MTKPERIPPVEPSEWTDEMRDLFAVMDPAGREKGPSRRIMTYLARHPVLSKEFMVFGRHLLFESLLPDRERELVTLYVAWRTKSAYEWISHVAFGLQVGLTEADVEAVKAGTHSPHWADADRNLLRAVDQMLDTYDLGDELWAALGKVYDQRQMMELVYTIGNYMQFAAVLKSFRIPLEPGMEQLAARYGTP